MDESNWWIYLMGAVVAYIVIPWRTVFKWVAVAVCAWLAYSFFTNMALPPIYQWLGGFFFGVLAIMAGRSEYRESESQYSNRRKDIKTPGSLDARCKYCNGMGKLQCFCTGKSGRPGILGGACADCNDTKYKRCYMCHGSGKR